MVTPKSLICESPINLREKDCHLFEKFAKYQISPPAIKTIKNAFVTHEGLVLKNGLLVQGCAFNLIGKEDNTFYYPFWRDTIEKYTVCKWGKSLKSVHIKEPCLLIHSKWFNYSFWVTGFLPRLIQAEENGLFNICKLIVPEGWKETPYVWESLKAFNVEHIIIPRDHHIFANELIMPETRQWTASFYPPIIQKTREKLITEANKRINKEWKGVTKVYLTRKKRGLRCVENENEVIEIIRQYKFEPITFEDLTIWEQISLMNQATHFISLHGAGFSNIMFMKENTSVLELINQPYAEKEYTFPFWKLANASNLKYYAQLCDIVSDGKKLLEYGKLKESNANDFLVNKNIIVNTVLLEDNLKLMTGK